MKKLARQGCQSASIRGLAGDLVQHLEQKDFQGECKALSDFVRDEIRYLKDTVGIECLHTAERVLMNRRGDCDDKAILLAALLLSIGHRGCFVAYGNSPDRFSHVWVRAFPTNGRALDLETTEPFEIGQTVPITPNTNLLTLEF